jgi:hypothetical protein
MGRDMKTLEYDPITAIHLPLSERVLDRLADILFATDEILDMIATQKRMPDDATRDVEKNVRGVYDQVNDLMKRLTD